MRIMVAGICIVVVLLGLAQPVAAGSIPAADVLEIALEGFRRIVAEGEIANGSLLTIIDYRQASLERRLFVYDPGQGVVLRASLVAHGRNSGQNLATCFGNEPDSRMSSLGFFVTGETYVGRHGYYDPRLNAHFYYLAGDSRNKPATMLVYRSKRVAKPR